MQDLVKFLQTTEAKIANGLAQCNKLRTLAGTVNVLEMIEQCNRQAESSINENGVAVGEIEVSEEMAANAMVSCISVPYVFAFSVTDSVLTFLSLEHRVNTPRGSQR